MIRVAQEAWKWLSEISTDLNFDDVLLFIIIIYFLFKGSHSCSQNNGMCSDLCLLKPRGYQCACPTGIVLKEDGKNCDYGEATYSMFQALLRQGGGKDFFIIDRAYEELILEEISFTNFEKVKMRATNCSL